MRHLKVVYKYTIPLVYEAMRKLMGESENKTSDDPDFMGRVVVRMPIGAELLSVGLQNDIPVVWALVDPDEVVTEMRKLCFINTGRVTAYFAHAVNAKFIGTVTSSTEIVWHLFG